MAELLCPGTGCPLAADCKRYSPPPTPPPSFSQPPYNSFTKGCSFYWPAVEEPVKPAKKMPHKKPQPKEDDIDF